MGWIWLKAGAGPDDANGMRHQGAALPASDTPMPGGSRRALPRRALGHGALGYQAFRAVDPTDDLAVPRALRVRALRDAVRSGRYSPSSDGVAEALLVWCVEPFPGPKTLARVL